jgi:hypothetical protein
MKIGIKMKIVLLMCLLMFSMQAFSHCGSCGSGDDHQHEEGESSTKDKHDHDDEMESGYDEEPADDEEASDDDE